MDHRIWTKEEEGIIIKMRDEEDMCDEDIAKVLNRSTVAVRLKISAMIKEGKLQYRRHRRWTKKAERIIIKMRDEEDMRDEDISKVLNRSTATVRLKISAMIKEGKLQYRRHRRWTKEEERIIIKMRDEEDMCDEDIAKVLNRSTAAVRLRISAMIKEGKLQYGRHRRWTKEEEFIIIEFYASSTHEELVAALKHHTDGAIKTKINMMKKEGRL